MSDLQYDPDADRAARHQEVYVGQRIASMLHDPDIEKALNGMLHGFQNQWLLTMDQQARELLWIKAQGLQEFINTLQSLIDTGNMAAAQLASMQNDSQEDADDE